VGGGRTDIRRNNSMPPTLTYPGVYIQELISPVHSITGVATSIAAFVGYTQSGIDNRAQQILSFADFQRLYGGLASNSELSYAVQQFFQNGGTEAYVVRTPGTSAGAKAATVQFDTLTFSALSSGAPANGNLLIDVDYVGLTPSASADAAKIFNLTVTDLAGGTRELFPSVTLDNTKSNFVRTVVNDPDNGSQLVNITAVGALPAQVHQSGITGNAITPNSIAIGLGGKQITGTVAVTQNNPGVTGTGTAFTTDLQLGQSVAISGDATNGIYKIQAITDNTHLTLTPPYGGANAPAATLSVVGTQATANFGFVVSTSNPATVPAGLPVTVKIPQGSSIPQSLAGIAAQLQQAINSVLAVQMPGATTVVGVTSLSAGGQALRINALLPGNPDAVLSIAAPPAGTTDARAALGLSGAGVSSNVAHYALGTTNVWGSQTASAAGVDGGLPASADLIGDPAAFTGIYALQKIDLFNLLSIPDATRANPADSSSLDTAVDPNAIYSAAIALCRDRRAFLLIDPPPNVNNVARAVDWKSNQLVVTDPNGAAFFPRLRLPDPNKKYQFRTFAPSGVVAGVYATTDASRGVWKAPAGIQATLTGVQAMTYQLTDAENGVLNPLGLNCFRTFPVYGRVLWGARTLVGADALTSEWKYVPVRRTALFLEESLYRGTKWVVFEPNDEPLWASIRLNVGSFMQGLFLQGAFQGKTPSEAYFVKCDKETTTQADIDLGIVNILVGFAPLKPAEFVVIKIQQITAQAQS
jgi:phage tail sheath protein FI